MRKFRCIKTLVMHDKTLYEKGDEYVGVSEKSEYVNIPNLTGKSHSWKTNRADFEEYFEEIIPLKKLSEIGVPDMDPKTFIPHELKAPAHYDNSKGSLYKVATERGWNPYLFDICKRLERGGKKDPLRQEIEKSIFVLQLWLKEHVDDK